MLNSISSYPNRFQRKSTMKTNSSAFSGETIRLYQTDENHYLWSGKPQLLVLSEIASEIDLGRMELNWGVGFELRKMKSICGFS